MRILLPPSEAKRPGGRGRPLAGRTDPVSQRLGASRAELFAALTELLDRPEAAAALLLPASTADAAIAANARAMSSPTLPAMQRYAGVVYEGLRADQLSTAAQRSARTSLLVFSGLLGVSRGGDPVPEYRVPAKATLPGVGIAGTYWRRRLPDVLPALLDRGPIIDLRSADYAAMWQPAAGSAEAIRFIGVRILSRTPGGRLAVVSYPSKLAKGRLAAALLERSAGGRPVRDAADVLAAWAELGGRDGRVTASTRGAALDLVE